MARVGRSSGCAVAAAIAVLLLLSSEEANGDYKVNSTKNHLNHVQTFSKSTTEPSKTTDSTTTIVYEDIIGNQVEKETDPYKFELPGITQEFLETLPGMSNGPPIEEEEEEDDESGEECLPGRPCRKRRPGQGAGAGAGGAGGGGATPSTATKGGSTNGQSDVIQLIGTDFQPGRLVNIFFGLIIMMFMMIAQGYAMWVFGIAFLPGTRSLDDWHLNVEVLLDWAFMVAEAFMYWWDRDSDSGALR